MAVAKWKQAIDREIRIAGGKVTSGRIYDPSGRFWGPRLDWTYMPSASRVALLKAWSAQAREARIAAKQAQVSA